MEIAVLNLDSLATMGLKRAKACLLGLPDMGPKTAACLLLFGLGLPALPVGTHVHRITLTFRLLQPDTPPGIARGRFGSLFGERRDQVYAFHTNAIVHQRAICKAQAPVSMGCPLRDCCDFFTGA